MILNTVTLENWQGYYGKAKFDFRGTGDKSSAFIYAENSYGKSAFWEGIYFALYGEVPVRNANAVKPVIEKDSADLPLLNVDLYGVVDAHFLVELEFEHEGEPYRLRRGYEPRMKNKKIHEFRQLKPFVTLENLAEIGSGKYLRDENNWIENNILPRRLAKFFLFDGERLEEYEALMTKEDNVSLRDDIEEILRTPVIKMGLKAFKSATHHFNTKLAEEKIKQTNDMKAIKDYNDQKKEKDLANKHKQKLHSEIKAYDASIAKNDTWLKENDHTKVAYANLEQLKERKKEKEVTNEDLKDDIIREMQDAWKTILSEKVDQAMQNLRLDKENQEKHIQQIALSNSKIEHLKSELEGSPCKSCKRPMDPPDKKRVDQIKTEILELKKEKKELKNRSKYPTVEEYYQKTIALDAMKTDKKTLETLIKKDTKLAEGLREIKKIDRNISKQKELISEEHGMKVKEVMNSNKSLQDKKNEAMTNLMMVEENLKIINENISKISKPDEKTSKDKSRTHRKVELSRDLSDAFQNVFSKTLEEYTVKTRKRVQERATDTFLQISNNRQNYSALEITDAYNVSIIDNKGRRDAGSQGQSMVMAYSLIEALCSVSGFEFPMVIDTPGRSLDRKNISHVYEYMTGSGRQVIFLPNSVELDPDDGDERYGSRVASTYQLDKTEDNRSVVVERLKTSRGGR